MNSPINDDLSFPYGTNVSLQQCFIQCLIPLEQKYILVMRELSSLLSSFKKNKELSCMQLDALNVWIDELDRRIITSQTLCANYQDIPDSRKQFELITYILFGDVRTHRAKENIREYINQRNKTIIKLKKKLVSLDSIEALKHHLQQYRQKEKIIRHFIDESTNYRPTIIKCGI